MLLKNGSTGYGVAIIQNNLQVLGFVPISIDGVFGCETESSVKKFQECYGLNIDGIVGDITFSKITNEIKKIQYFLNNYGYKLDVDRISGDNTHTALVDFQTKNNLIVDGIISNETSSALFKNNSTVSFKYNISDAGIEFITNYESFYSEPYRGIDSQNETIGYGHVIIAGENFGSITEEEAKTLLKKDLQYFVDSVSTLIMNLNLNQCQFDALVSFSYNCGLSALKNSTLLKDIKTEASTETIKEDFLMWIYCNKEKVLGLYRRRYDEYEMYSAGDYTRAYRDFE